MSKEYWTNDKMRNLVAGGLGRPHPEGFDPVEFVEAFQLKGLVLDFGCGDGRLCGAFHPSRYCGVDLNPFAVEKAKTGNPGYNFHEIDSLGDTPETRYDSCLAYTVFLHMDFDDVFEIIRLLHERGVKQILVAEILGREWRRPGNPPAFNRDLEDYINLFRPHGYFLVGAKSKIYERYREHAPDKNVRIFGLLFEDLNQ